MKFIITLLLMALPVYSGANCDPMNLVTEPNSPFQKIPVYDQDGMNICYSYAASQVADYHLIKKNGGDRIVHPLWGAMKFAKSINNKTLELGVSGTVINLLKSNGNCHRDDVTKILHHLSTKTNAPEADILSMLTKLQFKFDQEKRKTRSGDLNNQTIDQIIHDEIKADKETCSTNRTWEGILPQLRSLSVINTPQLFEKLLFWKCLRSKPLDLPEPKYNLSVTDEDGALYLQNTLQRTSAPVVVSYCATSLIKPDYVGFKRAKNITNYAYDEECANHESIVVGKKQMNNSCHFLLRNTFGTAFGEWTKGKKCLCKTTATNEFVDDCTAETHDNGKYIVEACWIPESTLIKNTYRFMSLENPPTP
jgi:hypothetical protein